MEKHAYRSLLSKSALAFGVVAALGAFAAGNCNVSATTFWVNVLQGKFGKLRECCHLMVPIKSNSLGLQLCSNSKWRWVNICFYRMRQVIKPRFPMTKGSPKSTLQFSSDPNEMFICWPWYALTVFNSRLSCHSPTTWEPPSASRVSAFTPSCSLSWPGGVFWRDMRRSSTHYASSPLWFKSLSPFAVSFCELFSLFCRSQMLSLQCV